MTPRSGSAPLARALYATASMGSISRGGDRPARVSGRKELRAGSASGVSGALLDASPPDSQSLKLKSLERSPIDEAGLRPAHERGMFDVDCSTWHGGAAA